MKKPTTTLDPRQRITDSARIVLEIDEKGIVVNGRLQIAGVRGFETLLEGVDLVQMPIVTGRICGVCPAAHHLVSIMAIENGLGIKPPKAATQLRELLYCGHMLQSHALSTFSLIGPHGSRYVRPGHDEAKRILPLTSDSDLARKLLRLRSIGQHVGSIVGGRGVHPVTVIPGGMARAPEKDALRQMTEWGFEALRLLPGIHESLSRDVLNIRDLCTALTMPRNSMALSNAGMVDYLAGQIIVRDDQGNDERSFSPGAYKGALIERVSCGSSMKAVLLNGEEEKEFFVGPLARLNVNTWFKTPIANDMLQTFHAVAGSRTQASANIEARVIEMVHCAERISELAGGLSPGPLRIADPCIWSGRYVGAMEAPRGLLIHDYIVDAAGKVEQAKLIVATQNNCAAMNSSITSLGRAFAQRMSDHQLLDGLEFALRCFDPCISCSTHVAGRLPLVLEIQSAGRTVSVVTQE